MIIRTAYPDELARARAFSPLGERQGEYRFLIALEDTPLEHIVSSMPFRTEQNSESPGEKIVHFTYFISSATGSVSSFPSMLSKLEDIAGQEGANTLSYLTGVREDHPYQTHLIEAGFKKTRTDRIFTSSASSVAQRANHVFDRVNRKIPSSWQIAPLLNQDSTEIFKIIAAHHLMTQEKFQNLWDLSGGETFSPIYSRVLLESDADNSELKKIIGVALVSERHGEELHAHAEAAAPDRMRASSLISAVLRQSIFPVFSAAHPNGRISSRTDSSAHIQGANTALRSGATEQPSRSYYSKEMH